MSTSPSRTSSDVSPSSPSVQRLMSTPLHPSSYPKYAPSPEPDPLSYYTRTRDCTLVCLCSQCGLRLSQRYGDSEETGCEGFVRCVCDDLTSCVSCCVCPHYSPHQHELNQSGCCVLGGKGPHGRCGLCFCGLGLNSAKVALFECCSRKSLCLCASCHGPHERGCLVCCHMGEEPDIPARHCYSCPGLGSCLSDCVHATCGSEVGDPSLRCWSCFHAYCGKGQPDSRQKGEWGIRCWLPLLRWGEVWGIILGETVAYILFAFVIAFAAGLSWTTPYPILFGLLVLRRWVIGALQWGLKATSSWGQGMWLSVKNAAMWFFCLLCISRTLLQVGGCPPPTLTSICPPHLLMVPTDHYALCFCPVCCLGGVGRHCLSRHHSIPSAVGAVQ